MIRGVIFDLGSTLIRFEGKWEEVLQESLEALVDALDEEGFLLDRGAFTAAYHAASREAHDLRQRDHRERTTESILRAVMTDFGYPSVSEEVVARVLRKMYAVSERRWKRMPGHTDLLDELRAAGYRMGMISNAGDESNVHRLIDNVRIRPYFDPILVSAGVGFRKPDPRVFQMVLEAWDLSSREVVMVGDMLRADVLGAQNAGLHHIWLTAAANSPENRLDAEVIVPEAVAERLADIPALIRNIDTQP